MADGANVISEVRYGVMTLKDLVDGKLPDVVLMEVSRQAWMA